MAENVKGVVILEGWLRKRKFGKVLGMLPTPRGIQPRRFFRVVSTKDPPMVCLQEYGHIYPHTLGGLEEEVELHHGMEWKEECLSQDKDLKHMAFKVVQPGVPKPLAFFLMSDSPAVCRKWIEGIQQALEDQKTNSTPRKLVAETGPSDDAKEDENASDSFEQEMQGLYAQVEKWFSWDADTTRRSVQMEPVDAQTQERLESQNLASTASPTPNPEVKLDFSTPKKTVSTDGVDPLTRMRLRVRASDEVSASQVDVANPDLSAKSDTQPEEQSASSDTRPEEEDDSAQQWYTAGTCMVGTTICLALITVGGGVIWAAGLIHGTSACLGGSAATSSSTATTSTTVATTAGTSNAGATTAGAATAAASTTTAGSTAAASAAPAAIGAASVETGKVMTMAIPVGNVNYPAVGYGTWLSNGPGMVLDTTGVLPGPAVVTAIG